MTIVPQSSDPASKYFTAFRIASCNGAKCFRADDIVQMRCFMAAFGTRGAGLFYQVPKVSVLDPSGVVPPSEDELLQRQSDYETWHIARGLGIAHQQWEPPPYVRIPNVPCLFYRTKDRVGNHHTSLACPWKRIIRGEYDYYIPHNVCRDPIVVEAASKRATLKPRGFTVIANGENGASGLNGVQSFDGGTYRGEMVKCGKDGSHGNSVVLSLSGDADKLTVSGTCNVSANLGGVKCEEVVFVNCRGGNGGTGGKGDNGIGSKGGDGGNAGAGGVCVLKASDPSLLMLVEADCMSGEPGSGGCGGIGGGGEIWDDPTRPPKPFKISDGRDGRHGLLAPCGGILWVVTSPNGHVMCQSPTRYDAKVTDLTVTAPESDGIFEPNYSVAVSDVLVVNSGGLTLPPGCIVSMFSTETVRFEPTTFTMPEIPPGSTFKVPITFHGRLCGELPPKTPGPFLSSAEFHPRIELLGRPFEKSFLSQKLTVQYPIKLAFLRCPEKVGQGDEAMLEVGVQNISSIPYGRYPGSRGKVTLQIHLDSRITPVVIDSRLQIYCDTPFEPDTITKHSSVYVQFSDIPPNDIVTVKVKVHMDRLAKPFEHCRWEAYLYLHNKLIEYNFEKVNVALRYIPRNPPTDVLTITDEHLTYREFVHCQHIFNILGVTADFWDVSHYKGLSVNSQTNGRHQVTWEGRYTGRMILYLRCNLKELWASDIVRHFHGPCNPEHDHSLEDLNSSMVLLMPSTPAKRPDGGDRNILLHLAMVDEGSESYSSTIYRPGPDNYKRLKKRLEHMEKEFPVQSSIALYKDTESTDATNHRSGSIQIQHLPLLRSCKFLVVSSIGGPVTDNPDDIIFSPRTTDIPLASNFGQTLLATLYGIPLRCKLNLIKTPPEQTRSLTFHLPNGYTLSKAELAAVCAAREIADDVLGCSSRRMNAFTEEVLGNTSSYTANGLVILRMMDLLEEELRERKKRLDNVQVSQAVDEVQWQIERVKKALRKRLAIRFIIAKSQHFSEQQPLLLESPVHY